ILPTVSQQSLPVVTPTYAVVFVVGYLSLPDTEKAGFSLNIIAIILVTNIPNTFTLNTIHLSRYCYHYTPHSNSRSPLHIHHRHFLDTRHYFLLHFHFPDHHFPAGHFRCFLHSLLDFRHCFLLHFPHFLLLRSLRPLLVLLPVPVQVLVLHIVLAVLA